MKLVEVTKVLIAYLLALPSLKNAKWMDSECTVKTILDNNKSIIRYGDGEILLMKGRNIHYQCSSKSLTEDLEYIINDYIDNGGNTNYILCLHPMLFGTGFKLAKSYINMKSWSYARRFFRHKYDNDVCFGDALVFGKGKSDIYSKLWENRQYDSVVFVHNNRKYADFFEETYKIKTSFVKVPEKNAYEYMERIYREIKDILVENNDLKQFVLISAGPCAKPLAIKLIHEGYTVYDTGHCWDDPLI